MIASSTAPLLAAEGVTVRYGRTVACDAVSVAVAPGEIVALLGRNGAGKSSLIRCLLGLRRPEAGTTRLFGRDAWQDRACVMARVGCVLEEPDAPGSLSATQLAAATSWMQPRWDGPAAADRLRRFGVPPRTPFGRLSKGEKSLVQLALALGHAPDLLVLDDPTLGLDVVACDLVFDEIRREHASRTMGILLATHEVARVEQLAHRVFILRKGRIVAQGDPRAVVQEWADSSGSLHAAFAVAAGAP